MMRSMLLAYLLKAYLAAPKKYRNYKESVPNIFFTTLSEDMEQISQIKDEMYRR